MTWFPNVLHDIFGTGHPLALHVMVTDDVAGWWRSLPLTSTSSSTNTSGGSETCKGNGYLSVHLIITQQPGVVRLSRNRCRPCFSFPSTKERSQRRTKTKSCRCCSFFCARKKNENLKVGQAKGQAGYCCLTGSGDRLFSRLPAAIFVSDACRVRRS